MTKIMDKKIFKSTDIIEVIKELQKINRRVQLSTIMQNLHEAGKYTHIDDYIDLSEKLIIMKNHNQLYWESDNENSLKASQEISLVKQ